MEILLALAYLVYALFWGRVGLYVLLWCRAARQIRSYRTAAGPVTPCSYVGAAAELVLFGRLFRVNPALWLGSWAFHVSFFFVVLGHLRYFMDPVPLCIVDLQRCGLLAGYLLPLAALYLVISRLSGREKYASRYNFFVLGLVLFICLTGLLMTFFFRPDLVDVKGFIVGMLTFRPDRLPGSFLFILHFLLVLLLVPLLPTHIFTAPFITIEAGRREKELEKVMHD